MILNPNQIETEIIAADLSQVVDRITRQYSDFPTAFQKEAIQNSWDAREDRAKGTNWLFRMYSLEEETKSHLIIEDFGTKGMNYERWEAFQSLWRPNKEHYDAGGQGQGKFVLMGASKNHTLIIESSSNEIPYKCKLLINERKSRDDIKYSISDFIRGASPLNHKGTKIWIYDVNKEFIKKIKSPDFFLSIIESWWQILGLRFNAKIQIFDQNISIPVTPQISEENILLENFNFNDFGRIKRLVLCFYKSPIPEIFQGIRVQRANMMITKVPFEFYNKEYQGRFSGYIEFDDRSEDSLEKLLKGIEKTDHCGFLYESPWKEIKGLIKEESEKFVAKIIPSKEEQKIINIKNLSQIIQKANQIINDYCPEILGGGTFVPPIEPKKKPLLRIKYLSINKKEAKYGDIIKPSCSIFNGNSDNKKISLCVKLKRQDIRISEEEYKLKIMGGENKSIRLSRIELDENKLQKGKYILRVTIKENEQDVDTKSTSFYLETKREPTKRGFVKIVESYHNPEEPIRYRSKKAGIIQFNTGHGDFENIWSTFLKTPNVLNKQIGFYIIKLCLDEALNELFKIKLKDIKELDPNDLIREIQEIRDKMYHDVYD